jgi:hypothetical protein
MYRGINQREMTPQNDRLPQCGDIGQAFEAQQAKCQWVVLIIAKVSQFAVAEQ